MKRGQIANDADGLIPWRRVNMIFDQHFASTIQNT